MHTKSLTFTGNHSVKVTTVYGNYPVTPTTHFTVQDPHIAQVVLEEVIIKIFVAAGPIMNKLGK